MPSNDIVVNGSITYIVVDSKMDELIAWLDKNCFGSAGKCLNDSVGYKEEDRGVLQLNRESRMVKT